jgi:hypothetical protein
LRNGTILVAVFGLQYAHQLLSVRGRSFYCIAAPINPLGLVAERGRDNIAVLLTIQRAHIFRRQSGVIAAPLNEFQILVSNLPADSIHSGGGSADRVILTSPVFELEYWS